MKKLLKLSAVMLCIAAISLTACDSGSSSSDNGDDTVSVTAVSLDKATMGVVAGSTGTLTATVAPSNATNQNVTWSSSDTGVATVSDGTVTGVAVGTATITVTTEDGEFTDTCDVTVSAASVAVTGVSLDVNTLNVGVGSTGTLTATIAPSDATNQNVTWSSSDTGVATVSDGTVTGVAVGTATITVTTEDGGFTDTCDVTVEAAGVTTLSTEFTSVPDVFTIYEKGISSSTWRHNTYGDDSHCAYSNAYSGGAQADEDWLISPKMSISSDTYFTFSEAINYGNSSAVSSGCKILYSTDYSGSGDPDSATWTELGTDTRSSGSSWTFVDVTVDVSSLAGQSSVYFAFQYISTTSVCVAWEIDWVEIGE